MTAANSGDDGPDQRGRRKSAGGVMHENDVNDIRIGEPTDSRQSGRDRRGAIRIAEHAGGNGHLIGRDRNDDVVDTGGQQPVDHVNKKWDADNGHERLGHLSTQALTAAGGRNQRNYRHALTDQTSRGLDGAIRKPGPRRGCLRPSARWCLRPARVRKPGSAGPWRASASRRRTSRVRDRGATGHGRPRPPC